MHVAFVPLVTGSLLTEINGFCRVKATPWGSTSSVPSVGCEVKQCPRVVHTMWSTRQRTLSMLTKMGNSTESQCSFCGASNVICTTRHCVGAVCEQVKTMWHWRLPHQLTMNTPIQRLFRRFLHQEVNQETVVPQGVYGELVHFR